MRREQVTVDLTQGPDRLKQGAPALVPNVGGDVMLVDAEDNPLVVVKPYMGNLAAYKAACKVMPSSTVLRAAGTRNAAVTFGFIARTPVMKRYECRACQAANLCPEAHAELVRAAELIWTAWYDDPLTRALALAAMDTAFEKIDPAWLMNRSPWTSGVLNTTSPLPYHYDRNNLPGAWSAMIVARRGVQGGHLSIPQLGVVLECNDGDVVYFQGQRFVHGVTPMQLVTDDAYRFTAVYYTIAKMQHCLEPEAELQRGRQERTTMEDTLIERQRASGHLT